MNATPKNTAVVTITSYENGWRPETFNYFVHSAKRMGISVVYFQRDKFLDTYQEKIVGFISDVASLPPSVEYVCYIDCRDAIFLKPIDDICSKFNTLGWPILMGASSTCHPHINPQWMARFGTHGTKFNFPNAGLFMAERKALENALQKLVDMESLIREDKVDSAAPFLAASDQFVWQGAYVEKLFPIGLDHRSDLFFNFQHAMYLGDFIDYKKCKHPNPLVTKFGGTPAIAHFTGHKSFAIPYFYKLLLLDALDAQLED